MPTRLDHIAIIVGKLEDGIAFYQTIVGLGEPVVRAIPELKIRCAFFPMGDSPIIELVEFGGTGEMVHGDVVVAIEVDDLDAALAHYKAHGVRVFDQAPTANLPIRRGWITKKDGHGTVIELCPRGAVAAFVRASAQAAKKS